MVQFVRLLRQYADCKRPGFVLVPQNAPELGVEAGYIDAVDGVAREDLYYGADGDGVLTPADWTRAWQRDLDRFKRAGKVVLSVDYPFTDADRPQDDAAALERVKAGYTQASARGYVHFAAVRALNHPTVHAAFSPQPPKTARRTLSQVKSWLYMLQPAEGMSRAGYLEALASAGYDLIVTDPEHHGDPLSSEEVTALKQRSKALLLAYLSIGEAETYRAYWHPVWDAAVDGIPDPGAPRWLVGANPQWPDNYTVRYWMPEWQALVLERLDAIIEAGFDGAYLDLVDAYTCFESGRCTP